MYSGNAHSMTDVQCQHYWRVEALRKRIAADDVALLKAQKNMAGLRVTQSWEGAMAKGPVEHIHTNTDR